MGYRFNLIMVLMLDLLRALAARYAYNTENMVFVAISALSMMGAGFFFIRLMKEEVGIIANALWIALGVVDITLASYFLFGEKLSLLQGAGMTTIVIGLIMTQAYAPAHRAKKATDNKNA